MLLKEILHEDMWDTYYNCKLLCQYIQNYHYHKKKFRPCTFKFVLFCEKGNYSLRLFSFFHFCIHFSLWKRALLLLKICAQMSLYVVKRRETVKSLSNECRQITRAIPKIRCTSGFYQHCPKFLLKSYI